MLRFATRSIAPRAVAARSCVTTTATRQAHLGAYGVFLKQVWKDKAHRPTLQALVMKQKTFGKAAKYIAAEYKKLSGAEKAKLAAAGKKITVKPRGKKQKFFAKKMKTKQIKALPSSKRVSAIAKLYKKRK